MNHEELHTLIDAAKQMAELSSASPVIKGAIIGSLLNVALAGMSPIVLQQALLDVSSTH